MDWEAPFLFADSRHAFYVTTGHRIEYVPDPNGSFGIHKLPKEQQLELKPLIWRDDRHLKRVEQLPYKVDSELDGGRPELDGDRIAVRNEIERLVNTDAYVHQAIDSLDAVPFDGVDIGPVGERANRWG